MKEAVDTIYGNRVRIRICGILIQEDKILLINHNGVGEKGSLWAPPGGGLEFGESSEQTLIREYKEETGLDIVVNEFLFVNEFFAPPLQAIELFFQVGILGGIISKGFDPEMTADKQIIQELRYWKFEDILLENPLLFHTIVRNSKNPKDLLSRRGHFTHF